MIAEGLLEEGLAIVKAARSGYDGFVRNPWNEYECGSYYARAMSSYALLSGLSGFTYSAAKKTLTFGPKLQLPNFKTFFSTASGYGTISHGRDALTISMLEGELKVDVLILTLKGENIRIEPKVVARAGEVCRIKIPR